MVRFATIILSALLVLGVKAQGNDTMTGIFDPSFKSLQLSVNGDIMAAPILLLDNPGELTISFDELTTDHSYLRYSLIHCNANWTPSQLVESEYLDGFNFGDIDTWDYSRMTTVDYVHYTISLPNEHFTFKLSGNYLLRVYRDDDPETTLLQARFMVTEAAVRVDTDIHTVTDIDYNDAHQQLSVIVETLNANIEDPYNDLMVYVQQNGRLDNEVMLRQPLRLSGTKVVYEHLRPLIFSAGNEYRRFETVSTTYPGMRVDAIEWHDPYYHATLFVDEVRAESRYDYDRTQNGRYMVREYNSTSSDIEADYMVVHFALDAPEMPNAMVFLDGDFTCRRFDPESLMVYNRTTGFYEKAMLLKQGSYNYQYLVAHTGNHSATTAEIEGNYHLTRNEYLIKVYYRLRGERYDRLIGTATVRL